MKLVAIIIMFYFLTLGTALLTFLPLLLGWNWGLVPALGGLVPTIGLFTSFCLALCIATTSAAVKGIELTSK
jgi:hypothetical protein